MARKLFGTDGVRGRANDAPMTAETALRLGQAAGRHFTNGGHAHRVLIGKDTRRSGYMIETALTAGFTSVGMDVFVVGPVPTPAVGMLARSMRADLGVMISASHNPFEDNGIKFFGPDGFKLSDAVEEEIEALLEDDPALAEPHRIGRATRIDDARGRYMEFAKTTFPKGRRLDGLKVVVDCANGAAYRTAPEVLWELGAEVIPVAVSPDGFNINKDCGSTHPEAAAAAVVAHGADLGISLDGDADRVLIIDEKGRVADGDQFMALIADRWAAEGRLARGTLVATVMSNLGLERHLEAQGLAAAAHRGRRPLCRRGDARRRLQPRRRAVGARGDDRLRHHRRRPDRRAAVPRGDGRDRQARERPRPGFPGFPQVLTNVRYRKGAAPLEAESVRAAISAGEARMGDRGRLVIRKSGTEPLVRIMGECDDPELLRSIVGDIEAEVARYA